MRVLWMVIIAMVWSSCEIARAADAPPATTQSMDDQATVIVVIGAEGESEYGHEFARAAEQWADAAKLGHAKLIRIGLEEATPSAPTDKERMKRAIEAQSQPSRQTLWIVLIGHGTFDGKEAKFNLRGPDLSDQELAEWLAPCRRPLAIIDCSSSSAPFLNRLSAANRIVITATQSGHELQYARFGEYMAASIADPAADLDKDGQTSLLEAFLSASHQVEAFYKEHGRLATEHALLDDNGDARGTPASFFQGVRATGVAKNGAPLDGIRAHQLHLVLSPAEQAMSPQSRARRDELERQIEALRAKKSTMPEAAYYASLDELLVKLAQVYTLPGKALGR